MTKPPQPSIEIEHGTSARKCIPTDVDPESLKTTNDKIYNVFFLDMEIILPQNQPT